MACKVGHLTAGDARGHLHDQHALVGDEQLRERDPVAQAQRVCRVRGDALRLCERVAEDRRRIDVDPADAEPDAGRPEAVG